MRSAAHAAQPRVPPPTAFQIAFADSGATNRILLEGLKEEPEVRVGRDQPLTEFIDEARTVRSQLREVHSVIGEFVGFVAVAADKPP